MKNASFRRNDVARPPEGEPWVWVTRDLNRSPAWRARSIYCARMIEFLQDQHMAHSGMENGNLLALYKQLAAAPWHLSPSRVVIAVAEGVGLGLIAAKRGGRRASMEASPTRYRLTFYATREKQAPSTAHVWIAPTNDWLKVTPARIAEVQATLMDMRSKQRPKRPKRLLTLVRATTPGV